MSRTQQATSTTSTVVASNTSPLVTVANADSLRARRLAAIQVTLQQRRIAAKQAKFVAVSQAHADEQARLAKQQAYQLAVEQLAAQYGIPLHQHVAPRANSATVVPSRNQVLIDGQYFTPCKAVHELAAIHGNRKDTLAACKLHGINPATAATQWGVYKKEHNL